MSAPHTLPATATAKTVVEWASADDKHTWQWDTEAEARRFAEGYHERLLARVVTYGPWVEVPR